MAPIVRQTAPQFSCSAVVPGSEDFQTVSLDDFKGKYLVLFFYPHDFTFVCPTEICAFSDRIQEFRDLNCEVVGASTNSVHAHWKYVRTPRTEGGIGPCSFPLLGDFQKKVATDYGVLINDESAGGDDGAALRGLFIIDGNQKLRHITVNDLPVGRDIDEVLRLVRAFKFTDEHGEVCPMSWRPGKPTMVDNHTSSKTSEFFASGQLNAHAASGEPAAKRQRTEE